jgi:hypothetical protein
MGIVVFAVFSVSAIPYWFEYKPPISPSKELVVAQQPDYLVGTQITHKQLDEIFPFGYKVIYFSENKLIKTEVLNTGQLRWHIDWDQLVVHPDVGGNRVDWFIPAYSAEMPSGEKIVSNVSTHFATLFKTSAFAPSPLGLIGKPNPFGLVLSDNQQMTIFAVGFRLLTAEEFNQSYPLK